MNANAEKLLTETMGEGKNLMMDILKDMAGQTKAYIVEQIPKAPLIISLPGLKKIISVVSDRVLSMQKLKRSNVILYERFCSTTLPNYIHMLVHSKASNPTVGQLRDLVVDGLADEATRIALNKKSKPKKGKLFSKGPTNEQIREYQINKLEATYAWDLSQFIGFLSDMLEMIRSLEPIDTILAGDKNGDN